MIKAYKITPPSTKAMKDVLKALKKQRLMTRPRGGLVFTCASTEHQYFISRVCHEFNSKLDILDKIPEGIRAPSKEEYVTPCGEKFFDSTLLGQHVRSCGKCMEINKQTVLPEVKKKELVVAKLEPGQELDLDGVILSIEVVIKKVSERLDTLKIVDDVLKKYRASRNELAEVYMEADLRLKAAKLLINKETFR